MITETEIKKVAALARLGLTQDEINAATKDVDNILQHFSVIQKIDTSHVAAADEDQLLMNVSREDKVVSSTLASEKDLVSNAPKTHGNHIQVPAVFGTTEEAL